MKGPNFPQALATMLIVGMCSVAASPNFIFGAGIGALFCGTCYLLAGIVGD